MRIPLSVLLVSCATGCTSVATAVVQSSPDAGRDVFVTQADLDRPYQSLGPVQVTRKGLIAFGFANPADIDLQTAIDKDLVPEVRRVRGDGVINVRYHQTHFPTVARIFGAIFFFVPLPVEVTVTGEIVRLTDETPPPSRQPGQEPPPGSIQL